MVLGLLICLGLAFGFAYQVCLIWLRVNVDLGICVLNSNILLGLLFGLLVLVLWLT